MKILHIYPKNDELIRRHVQLIVDTLCNHADIRMVDNYTDFKAANQAVGRTGAQAPEGYTWHHMEDGKNMLMVRTDIHSNFPHTGGASLARAGGV